MLEKTLEARIAQDIINNSPVILFRRQMGDVPRFDYVSGNIQQFGYRAEDFCSGRLSFKDIVHPEDSKTVFRKIRSCVQEGLNAYSLSYRIVTKNKETRWVKDHASVIRDADGKYLYHQGMLIDITSHMLIEEKLRKNEAKFRRIIETAGEGFLMMDGSLVIREVNEAFCRMTGHARDEIMGKIPLDLATDEFRKFLTANREKFLARDYREFEGMMRAKNGRSIPIVIHGNTLRDRRGIRIGNIAFVTDLTEQKRALILAGRVQRSLSPSAAPVINGLDIAGRSDPCDEVGGDYFDFLFNPEYSPARLKVFVGDISGHGVDSALLMATARAFIRSRAARKGSLSQMVSSINQELVLDLGDSSRFMTLFGIELDPADRSVCWVRAGHDPALIYDPATGKSDRLIGAGIPLGIDEAFTYTGYSLSNLSQGMVIAIGTDGIWDACNPAGTFFGKERFQRIIHESAAEPANVIIENVFSEVKKFLGGNPAQDDITLVVIKIKSVTG